MRADGSLRVPSLTGERSRGTLRRQDFYMRVRWIVFVLLTLLITALPVMARVVGRSILTTTSVRWTMTIKALIVLLVASSCIAWADPRWIQGTYRNPALGIRFRSLAA